MTQKAPSPGKGRKQTTSGSRINSQSNKAMRENSVWNVICESPGCGWSAQFATGREAGEAGWKHHRTHHQEKTGNSHHGNCPSTHIFKTAKGKGHFPVSFTGEAYQKTSGPARSA